MKKVKCMDLKSWYEGPANDLECKECALSILVAWYADEVGKDVIKRFGIDGNVSPEEAIEILDSLKNLFPHKAERLKQLDCYIQEAASELLKKQ